MQISLFKTWKKQVLIVGAMIAVILLIIFFIFLPLADTLRLNKKIFTERQIDLSEV